MVAGRFDIIDSSGKQPDSSRGGLHMGYMVEVNKTKRNAVMNLKVGDVFTWYMHKENYLIQEIKPSTRKNGNTWVIVTVGCSTGIVKDHKLPKDSLVQLVEGK